MQLAAINDDKHNDVWVSCCHGDNTSFGTGSQRVLFLINLTEKKRQATQAKKKKTTTTTAIFYRLDLRWSRR